MAVDRFRNIKSLTNDKTKVRMDTARAEEICEIDTSEDAIEKFVAKAKQFRDYPPAQFTYHAYSNSRDRWTVEKIMPIIEFARKHNLEVRAWENERSGMNLVVVKDSDTTEDSGMELYEAMQGKYEAYGLASWYEFDKWGVPIYVGEDAHIKSMADGNGIWIGKSSEDCVTLW